MPMWEFPEKIKKLIDNEPYQVDDVGMSDSTVILFRDRVLKIQTVSEESENEYNMMEWLQGRLPVPKVLGFDRQGNKNYLLMSKVPGEMACAESNLQNPEELAIRLAEALKLLWETDISGCPFVCNLDKKLEMAEYAVKHHLVDLDNVEPETFGENGFRDPEQLLDWLKTNRPEEDLVLSHGDFCLQNVFLSEGRISSFIDLGKTGIADRWQDIALCYRSLKHNMEGKFGGKVWKDFRPEILFEKLEIEPDWEKLRYYILMDELF